MAEKWLPVVGYESMYEVSDGGLIRSLDRWARVGHGATRFVRGKFTALTNHKGGYLVVSLNRNNKVATRLVHRLVAESFIGPIGPGLEVNHKDGDKRNNHVGNLEIVSRQGNINHAVGLGLIDNKGEKNTMAKITEDVARMILADHASGLGYKRIAKKRGVSWSVARSVATRKTWRHVTASCD